MNKKSAFVILMAATIIGFFIFLGIYFSNSGSNISGKATSHFSFVGEKVVSKVIDGDTVVVEGESIRLLGMDADERGYPCYNEAKKRLEELVLSKEVILEADVEDKDQYDRYLRYIFLDGKNINLQLVEEGMAVARFYPENQKYKEEIVKAEITARENKVGCKWREL